MDEFRVTLCHGKAEIGQESIIKSFAAGETCRVVAIDFAIISGGLYPKHTSTRGLYRCRIECTMMEWLVQRCSA